MQIIQNPMEQQRKSYQEKAHQSLDELFKAIESLEEKIRTASKDFSEGMEKNIADLKVESEKLKTKYKEMSDTSNESWDEVRNGFEQAATSLRDAFGKAWKKFQEK